MGCSVKWIHLLSIVYALSSVSAEGVIGAVTPSARAATAVPELCAACVTGCRTISGLFTRPQMPPGYSLVTQVPKGACRLVVSQLKHTRNFIALRNPNGTFILNGNYQDIGRNREVEAVGTRFTYRRQVPPHSEIITAPGPLAHPVDIMMVYNQPNPGIKYEYMIPIEQTVDHIAPPFIDLKKPQTDTVKPQIDSHKHQTDLYRPQLDLHKPTSDSHRTQTDSHRPQPDVHNPHNHVGHNRPHTDNHGRQTDVHKPHNEVPVEPRRLDKPLTTLSQGDDSRPLRRRRRKFVWKITGMTSCSKTCGGGVQYPIVVCVREHNQAAVLERRCTGLEKPRNQTTRCNTQPCPAHWGGTWSACSTTCGPGEQTRVLECLQEISATLTMRVKDGACLEPRPATTRRCDLAPCETRDNELEQELPSIAQWHTDHWSQCSVTCGTGVRTRSVTCNGKCRAEDRPSHAESCHAPLCSAAHVLSQTPPASSASISWWLATDWSEQCSEGCGTGTQSRWVTCPTGECDPNIKPETSRACSSDKQCGGKWYTGPWGPCTDSCGAAAKQKREVLCVVHVRGQARIVSDMTCPAIEKPVTEKICEGTCPSRWFTGEWGTCEGQCPNGVQRREVRCLEYDGRYATSCTEDMPPLKRSCHCSLGLSTKTDYTSRESSQAQDEPSPDRGCVDQFTNCPLVVQARLCQYPYYKTSCCLSCRKNHQDPRE